MRLTYLLPGLLLLASCTKSKYNPVTATPAIRQYIAQDTSLSLFQLALERSGLDTALSSGGPFTVFAPVNSAWVGAGLTANKINAYDPQGLAAIVGNHILKGRIGSATVQGFTSDSMISLNPLYQPLVELNYYGLFINGIAVIQGEGNIGLGDGILHKIGQVAFPPIGNLLQTLDSIPDTQFAAYIFHHSPALVALATNVAASFQPYVPGEVGFFTSDNGNLFSDLTLLVPSDEAFGVYGINSIAELAALDSATRTSFVSNTALLGTYFTPDFMGGRLISSSGGIPTFYIPGNGKTIISTLLGIGVSYFDGTSTSPPGYALGGAGGTYEFESDGLSILGEGTLTPPQIVQPNIIASDGVIHVLNQVFTGSGNYIPGGRNPPQN